MSSDRRCLEHPVREYNPLGVCLGFLPHHVPKRSSWGLFFLASGLLRPELSRTISGTLGRDLPTAKPTHSRKRKKLLKILAKSTYMAILFYFLVSFGLNFDLLVSKVQKMGWREGVGENLKCNPSSSPESSPFS